MNDTPTCTWTELPYGECWEAACGDMFVIDEGTPTENGMKFCMYCGGPIKEKRWQQ